ncbi:diacylglycerol/lipid kinase family protein [Pseudogemmobacter faecipullorum]|uniref:NAD(+)/NADH kinase n=1 Tax=Pseudogemmobacter faecipullorum TaxID=2755041 RepID=A0ABS8CH68_9RHOB|nr:diacylglycerol kinase family protein [Pseudogemmobacter faecipullorum]MCB5408719.1 NAD(+)/NADH kinase [Pseudogemmobacter faecipullorum]
MTRDRPDLAGSHFTLLANTASGNKDTSQDIAMIRARIEPQVARFSLVEIHKGDPVQARARAAVETGADIIGVLGGDGTQTAAAGVLAGTEAAMAVLPGGTFNYFSRGLGGGETLEEALHRLEHGRIEARDLAEVNGHVFLNNASFGLYPAILERREKIYHRWGRSRLLAYWSVILSLAELRDPMRLSLSARGKKRDIVTPLIFAARSHYQLESFGLDGAEAIRNGQFVLLIARGQRRRELVVAALRLAFGQAARGRDFEVIIADDILIESRRNHRLVALDGEKQRIEGPWHLQIREDALKVIVPLAQAPDAAGGEDLLQGRG